MQKDIFKNGEGNNWFRRNKDKKDRRFDRYKEHVVDKINTIRKGEKYRVLEIGCSYGWGVNMIDSMCDSYGVGIDPSSEAIIYGKSIYPNANLVNGTADDLPFNNSEFDVIVFAFCLYLCDEEDLFKIAYEADRVLKNGGFVIIIDFDATDIPYFNEYKYRSDIKCIKMNFSNMFLWHPAYTSVYKDIFDDNYTGHNDEREAVHMLRKNEKSLLVKNPF